MSTVPSELQQALSELDPPSASLLEQLVRDALALVRQKQPLEAPKKKTWPPGYFEKTAGSFANEPLEAPADPPPSNDTAW